MKSNKSAVGNTLEGDFADFLLQTMPVGIIVINDTLEMIYRNEEGRKFLKRYGMPEEITRIGGRILEAFHSSRLEELFPGEVYIEKRLDRSTSKWLFRLHMLEGKTPRIVVFIIEEAISNQLNMNEIRVQYGLTRRETDILRRVLKGLKNTDIAEELGVCEQTIKDHLSNIYGKIKIDNRNDLMRIFISPDRGKSVPPT